MSNFLDELINALGEKLGDQAKENTESSVSSKKDEKADCGEITANCGKVLGNGTKVKVRVTVTLEVK